MVMTNRLDSFNMIGMKRYWAKILIVFLSVSVYGQNLDKANKLFANKAYIEAIEIYKNLEPSKQVSLNLADAYYYNSDVKNAAKIYETLYSLHKDSLPQDFYFKYADALKGIGQYYKSDVISEKYLGSTQTTEELRELLKTVVPYSYEIEELTTFAKTPSFGPAILNNSLIFSAPSQETKKDYKWNNQPYLDLYISELNEDNSLDSIRPIGNKINSNKHESSAVFTSDGKTMYFSRTNNKRHKVNSEMVATVKLYRAELIDGNWDNIEELEVSSDYYSVQHPALNKDETKLYFASDMPGSLGSFDIYYIDLLENNSLGEPVNLGPVINTEYREQFPCIEADNTIVFSSNGHFGFGGLDLFSSKFEANTYLTPLNLGEELNSSKDDFSYSKGRNDEEAFFASNRNGTDQLYHIKKTDKNRAYVIQGFVLDKNSQEVLPGTKVSLYDSDDELLEEVVADENGRYELKTGPNKTYKIEGFKPLYIPSIRAFDTNDSGDIEFNIELEIESYDDAEELVVSKDDGLTYIELENIYFDFNRWEIKPEAARTLDVLIELLKKYPRMEVELGAHTDSRSTPDYNLKLSENRANAALEYIVSKGIDKNRVIARGYGEFRPLVDCGDNCSDVEYSINRRCEFIILK